MIQTGLSRSILLDSLGRLRLLLSRPLPHKLGFLGVPLSLLVLYFSMGWLAGFAEALVALQVLDSFLYVCPGLYAHFGVLGLPECVASYAQGALGCQGS